MDQQFYRPQQQNSHRSENMEMASFVCGILSILTICFVYPALILGSLGIVFALLSRGGEMTLSNKARIGLILGSIGLGIILLMLFYTIVFANVYFGGLEEMMREMYESIGLDYENFL